MSRDPTQADFAHHVDAVLGEVRTMLLAKNEAYGSSALDPLRVFATAGPAEGIRVRIDDKLSRLARGRRAGGDEDTVSDLLGYLVILLVARRMGLE